jgi:hypothetical protein
MATMKNIPDDLASLITCYIAPKPKTVYDLLGEMEMSELQAAQEHINKLMKAYSTQFTTRPAYNDDTRVVIQVPHKGETVYLLNKTDYDRIAAGAEFKCNNDFVFEIKTDDGVFEPVIVWESMFDGKDEYTNEDYYLVHPEVDAETLLN